VYPYPEDNTCPLTVDVSRSSGVALLVVAGEVDMSTCPALERAINAAMEHSSERVELDLSGVSFADSSVLSLLMRLRRDTGSRLTVGSCSHNVERLFAITGINPLLGRPPLAM
jgi:anti-sigma B factor antagonist